MTKPPRRPTFAQLEKTVADWNANHPIGTPVTYYALMHPLRDPRPTKTTSEASIMGGHSAVVKVESISGFVALEAVRTR